MVVVAVSWSCGERRAVVMMCVTVVFPGMRRDDFFRGISIEMKGLNLFPLSSSSEGEKTTGSY